LLLDLVVLCSPMAALRADGGQTPATAIATAHGHVRLSVGGRSGSVPLQGALVRFESSGWFKPDPPKYNYTDKDGNYTLTTEVAFPGEYLLSVEAPDGQQQSSGPIRLGTDMELSFNFPSRRNYIDAFRDGVMTLEYHREQKAAAAAGAIRESIALAAGVAATVTEVRLYGMRWAVYAPGYFLSQALFQARECKELDLEIEKTEDTIKNRESVIKDLRTRCPLQRGSYEEITSEEQPPAAVFIELHASQPEYQGVEDIDP
jgi:hypothetical protein